jgi:hypothetical protein
MRLITSVGLFSVVQEVGEDDLTVWARERDDLERLREIYLPSLGPIGEQGGSDLPYRARASHRAPAGALYRLAEDIDYPDLEAHLAEVEMPLPGKMDPRGRSRS